MEFRLIVDGDRFVGEVLSGDSGENLRCQLSQLVEHHVKEQTRRVVKRWAEETDQQLDYEPEVSVSLRLASDEAGSGG